MKKYVYIIWVCFLFSFSLIQGQECGSVPNQQQLAALQDSTSLFNRRLQVVEDILLKDLPKIQAIEPLGEQFIVKRAPRFSTSSGAPVIQIPIVAHILRRSNGRDGLSVSDLYASVERTNKLYYHLPASVWPKSTNKKNITIGQLLSHRSGIHHYGNGGDNNMMVGQIERAVKECLLVNLYIYFVDRSWNASQSVSVFSNTNLDWLYPGRRFL